MKIIAAGVRMFLNRSAKNDDGGWTKGELELSLEASLEEGDDPKQALESLKELVRKELYKTFKVKGNSGKKLKDDLANFGRTEADF
jgi:hypothetical protein